MSRLVTIVDYGLGNLFSVARALSAAGAQPLISERADELLKAERLVLPGVGAFGDGIRGLRERGLDEPIREFVHSGRPLIGLCLGMQLLFESGSEFGEHRGLGLIPGRVAMLDASQSSGESLKLPHVGWNGLLAAPGRWRGTLFESLSEGAQVYFVHSYAPVPRDPSHVLAECAYGTRRFCAAVQKDNVTGCQFHPEKSAAAGLKILARFLEAR